MNMHKTDKMVLRLQTRKKRSSLTDEQQRVASLAIAKKILSRIPEIHNADRIAFYLAQDGEIDLLPLMSECHKQGKNCFLPVLDQAVDKQLKFAEWTPAAKMLKNKYGINEPQLPGQEQLSADDLQLIFMPLVAFDGSGNRLGMGGGYYDRSLSNCRSSKTASSCPLLIATGHEIQFVSKIPHDSWDIQPDMTITPDRILRASSHRET